MSDVVGNSVDRFCRDVAHLILRMHWPSRKYGLKAFNDKHSFFLLNISVIHD